MPRSKFSDSFLVDSSTKPSFDYRSLRLSLIGDGDSYLRNGVVGLPRDVTVPFSSSGTIINNNPVQFLDPESNATASFSTRSSFSIKNVNPSPYGDGLAFFLSKDNQTLGSPGGYLGLVNSSQLTKNRFLAIEFDTKLDAHCNDPDDNHVGLDIESLNSIKTANPILQEIDLKSGDMITAPILSVDIDLSGYLKEYVGLAFFLSKDNQTLGSPGGYLGLVNSSQLTKNRFLSIEFDTKLGLGFAGPAFFCAFLVAFGYISVKKWQKMKVVKGLKAELVTGPREFSYKELSAATKGFHSSRVIGRGAFGNVYKAYMISTGTLAAVKRSKHSHEGKAEFLAELSIIACLRHKNLVQLQGWCVEKGEVLVVYEFMPYGSLDRLLYQEPDKGTVLSWSLRQSIAVGLASALTYLRLECEQQVIHRDIKTSNIMSDANFNARLGDFGLARLMEHDKSHVSTLTAGTMGCLAPEYLHCGKATEKTDVFSYGVVILELACYLKEAMYVGFSGSTEGSNETHLIENWVCPTFLFGTSLTGTGAGAPPGFPGSTSHPTPNVSDTSVISLTGTGAPPGFPGSTSHPTPNVSDTSVIGSRALPGLALLLVDHSFASRYVTRVILGRLGRQYFFQFVIREASNEDEVNELEEEEFDFVIQNISFPGGEGIAGRYKERGVEVIVIHPAWKARYIGRYTPLGVTRFIVMPVTVKEFSDKFIRR